MEDENMPNNPAQTAADAVRKTNNVLHEIKAI